MQKIRFLIIVCVQLGFSQNLVLNPGFEEQKKCPSTIGTFNQNVNYWSTPNLGSTDYFNICSKTAGGTNFFGSQEPRTGKGFAGMYLMAPENYREYIQGTLSNPLIYGETYTVTFFISLAENCSHAIRDLGVMFLNEPYEERIEKVIKPNKVLNEVSKSYFVLINSQNHYTQKSGWEKITFQYIAKGFETAFVIGNFDKNSKISKIKVQDTKNPDASYYFIDDVSIEQIKPHNNSELTVKSINKNQLLENDKIYVLKNVLFAFNKYVLEESSKAELNQLFVYLDNNKRLQIEIYGHTDDVGAPKVNEELSLLRAKEVALYLISMGLRPERVKATGFGNRFPVASNITEEGRTLNRRVEFKLTFR